MYRLVYVDNNRNEVTFYDDTCIDEDYVVIDPNLELDVSTAGSGPLTFQIPTSNIAYDKLKPFITELKCYKRDKEIWSGRITDIDGDFCNTQSITCEGEFAYLNDTCQPQKEYYNVTLRQFLEDIIKTHNIKVTTNGQGPIDRQFTVGYVSPNIMSSSTGDIIIPYILTEYETTMKCIEDNILSKYNCYIRVRKVYDVTDSEDIVQPIVTSDEHYLNSKDGHYLQYGAPVMPYHRYIDIITEDEFATNQTQQITFGENLLDYTKHYAISELATVVVATGKATEEKGITDEKELLCPTQRVGLVNKAVLIVNKDGIGNEYIDWKRNYPGLEGYDERDTDTSDYQVTQDIAVEEDDVIFITTRLPKAGYKDEVDVYTEKTRTVHYTDPETGKDRTRKETYIEHTTKVNQYAFCIYYIRNGNAANSRTLTYKATTKVGDTGFTDLIETKVTIPKGGKVLNVSYYKNSAVKIEVQKAVKSENTINKYLDVTGAAGSLMISDKEINGVKPHIGRLTWAHYQRDYTHEQKMTPTEWWYITDRDMLVNREKVYKRGIYTINPDALAKYGWIEKQLNLSDIEDNEELLQYANDYIMNGQWDEMTIEVTTCDLSALGTVSDDFELFTSIMVNSEPHGLDRYFPLTKMSIPLAHPEDLKYTLGNYTEQSLTESSNQANQEVLAKLKSQPQVDDILKSAFSNAAALINAATTGTVTMNITDEGAEEILIHDGPKTEDGYKRAKNVWRWNINGLGHGSSPTGRLNEAYQMANTNLAMTMDGRISANFITAGVLSALNIHGCNIKIGQYGYSERSNGSLTMQNNDGTYALRAVEPEQGVLFESKWGPYFESPRAKTNCRIVDGELYFALSAFNGSMADKWPNVTCILNGRTRIETPRGAIYGGSIKAPNFTIAADHVWVDTVNNPKGVSQTITGNVDAGIDRFEFINGMCIGHYKLDNQNAKTYKVACNNITVKNGSVIDVKPIEGHKPIGGTITVGDKKYVFEQGVLTRIDTKKEQQNN